MQRIVYIIFGVIFSSLFAFGAHAAELPRQSVSARVCGAYRYDINRLVDGFLIKVTDGARVRSVFHHDLFSRQSVYNGNASKIVSECQGDALAIVNYFSSKYGHSQEIQLLDPASMRITTLGSRSVAFYNGARVSYAPAEAQARIEQILAQPQDDWFIAKTELVQKQQILAEKSDMLNDKSFFIFDGKGGMIRQSANSFWNTTEAIDSVVCENNIAYVLYVKKFAERDTATSTFPALQYIVERSGDGARKLVAVPFEDGSWKKEQTQYMNANFGSCFGSNASIFVNNRVTIISKSTLFANWSDPHASINPGYRDAEGKYYVSGVLTRTANGIVGEAAIKTLNGDGSVLTKKPVYFRDLMSYPVGSSMEFLKDPRDAQTTMVKLRALDQMVYPTIPKYFVENDGVYREVDGQNLTWAYAWSAKNPATPLYVAIDKNILVLKSFFLEKPMFLHGLPHGNVTLLWQRIGPLERDGSRKVWYAFKIDGQTQTWLALVR